MKVTDFYNEVARLVDTEKTQINVAETKRVLAMAFQVLAGMDVAEATDLIAKGIAQGKKKLGK